MEQQQHFQVEQTVQPFDISEEELHEWTRRPHRHNFFELVFIRDGTGSQCINGSFLPYEKDSIFLLPPYDCHSFRIQAPTQFVFIRFNALFFQEDKWQLMDYSQWFRNLHYILSSYNRKPGDVIHSPADKALMVSLITSMLHEKQQPGGSESIIRTNMVAMLNVLVRNFENSFRESHQARDQQVRDLLQYIQYHLFDNDKLKVEAIARAFNLAPTYVGEYFKKKVGENLKEYILKARVNVAQSRMQYSGQSVKEIAYDLGFTDASHLMKVIKKYYQAAGQAVCSSLQASA
ncbi:AraC family transcriptional regulator [Paraflavisolibacter sp. H34]|uniref:AraC family transcriptional regulator n=1 Tax=Huijunlia imazamoxiresistens TaxID=3127457 RepID=UPI00301921A5